MFYSTMKQSCIMRGEKRDAFSILLVYRLFLLKVIRHVLHVASVDAELHHDPLWCLPF